MSKQRLLDFFWIEKEILFIRKEGENIRDQDSFQKALEVITFSSAYIY